MAAGIGAVATKGRDSVVLEGVYAMYEALGGLGSVGMLGYGKDAIRLSWAVFV
eukprot:CAMPEP_0201981592 /NCGR_PEP_ID=MMETSP0904-20121228/74038_1 /ASSEMBLY_ACC=CAM_ASM_000553 /TAXON_ID=420261 /ORGANISM="Thalassiosira antarctica, Strain CCMP982" /LENGTH=52 /DNA_ID=CAMNT_0048534195 /DNA_START=139 /DNA_END=297 /DNA_ORIENTATION=+